MFSYVSPMNAEIALVAGLEKSPVLPALDRFLSLKTDFVLNRKQKKSVHKSSFFFSANS